MDDGAMVPRRGGGGGSLFFGRGRVEGVVHWRRMSSHSVHGPEGSGAVFLLRNERELQ